MKIEIDLPWMVPEAVSDSLVVIQRICDEHNLGINDAHNIKRLLKAITAGIDNLQDRADPATELEGMRDNASDLERHTLEWSIALSAVRLLKLKRTSAPHEVLDREKGILLQRVIALPLYKRAEPL